MTMFDAGSEAEWMAETIIEDFALSLDMAERIRFYSRLVELLTARRNEMQQALEGGERPGSYGTGPLGAMTVPQIGFLAGVNFQNQESAGSLRSSIAPRARRDSAARWPSPSAAMSSAARSMTWAT